MAPACSRAPSFARPASPPPGSLLTWRAPARPTSTVSILSSLQRRDFTIQVLAERSPGGADVGGVGADVGAGDAGVRGGEAGHGGEARAGEAGAGRALAETGQRARDEPRQVA